MIHVRHQSNNCMKCTMNYVVLGRCLCIKCFNTFNALLFLQLKYISQFSGFTVCLIKCIIKFFKSNLNQNWLLVCFGFSIPHLLHCMSMWDHWMWLWRWKQCLRAVPAPITVSAPIVPPPAAEADVPWLCQTTSLHTLSETYRSQLLQVHGNFAQMSRERHNTFLEKVSHQSSIQSQEVTV